MWSNSNHDKNIPPRGFSTPPASWKSQHSPSVVMPMSERKSNISSSGCRRDVFHVIHKVPSGDSPYVRAKHVQLIDKDPSRAISLFWAAINAGDRVDSALKDMAVVMKQLDRSDEAIEAIKSFRHLCPYESQESLDNVLVELYKRSGRIEEEIEMLQHKLKNLEEGIAFGGKRTKTARSQGKKVQITIEQEKSRILGNLAWAYLQHHDYGSAEQHYRKALSLEPDKNKQCNLAICLMHMNRITEAKSLLQAISASCGSTQMDESYAKSFERAVEMLTEFESKSVLRPAEEDNEIHKSMAPPAIKNWKQVSSSNEEVHTISGFIDSRRWMVGQNKELLLSDMCNGRSYYGNHCENQGNFFECNKRFSKCISSGLRGNSLSSQPRGVDSDWRKDYDFESPGEKSSFPSKMEESWIGSTHKKMLASPAAVLYTQPRRLSWRLDERDQRRTRWEEDTIEKPSENLLAHSIQNIDGELLDLTDGRSAFSDNVNSTDSVGENENSTKSATRSWADMVEEEEQQKLLVRGKYLSPCFDDRSYKGDSDDENQDSNRIRQKHSSSKSPIETISQKLEALKDGYDTFSDSISPRNPMARRSLCFADKKDMNVRKKNRLQVFRDITPSPDSP